MARDEETDPEAAGSREPASSAGEESAAGSPETASPPREDANASGENMREFGHYESIYSFMIFYPEIIRMQRGHYYSRKVWQAWSIVLLNLMLQLGLTRIAGNHIWDEAQGFSRALGSMEATSAPLSAPLPSAKKLSEIPTAIFGEEKRSCCLGYACARSGVTCCPNANASYIAANPTHAADLSAADVHTPRADLLSLGRFGKPKAKHTKHVRTAPSEAAGTERPLCRGQNGQLDCTPHVFAFIGQWHLLDVDGDGLWSFQEAQRDESNVGCHMMKPPVQVFRSITRSLERETGQSRGRRDVTKKEFMWWEGMVAICSMGDETRCGQLIVDGVFDGVLSADVKVDDVLTYCQKMLAPGGSCGDGLPVTYRLYRERMREQCGPREMNIGQVLQNPQDPQDRRVGASVGYAHVQRYDTANTLEFKFFTWLIFIIWYATLLKEISMIIRFFDFSWSFPKSEGDAFKTAEIYGAVRNSLERPQQSYRDLTTYARTSLMRKRTSVKPDQDVTLDGISSAHRVTCFLLVAVRGWMLCYMTVVGTVFILATFSYADLLMNAVALAFIFELPEFLYGILVPQKSKGILEAMEVLMYESRLPSGRWVKFFTSKYMLGAVVIPLLSMLVVWLNNVYLVVPIDESLHCLCNQTGPRCFAAQHLNRAWWRSYWESTWGQASWIARLSNAAQS